MEPVNLQIRVRTDADSGPIQQLGRNLGGLTENTRTLTSEMRAGTRAAYDFGMVFRGLERGGLGGTMSVLRGMRGLIRVLGPEMVASAGMMAPAIAIVTVAVAELNRRTAENRKEMQHIWDDAKQRAEAYKLAIEAIDKAAEKMAKDFRADIDDINERMKFWEEQMAEADKRSEAKHAAAKKRREAEMGLAEEKEMAAAVGPEGREAVTRKYDRMRSEAEQEEAENEVVNQKLKADRDKEAAQRAKDQAIESQRSMQLQLNEAKQKAEDSAATATDIYRRSGVSDFQLKAQEKAKEDQAAYKVLAEKLEPEMKKSAEIIAETDKKLAEAATVLETIPDLSAAALAGRGKAQVKSRAEDISQVKGMETGLEGDRSQADVLAQHIKDMEEENLRMPGLTPPERLAKLDAAKAQLTQLQSVIQDSEITYGQTVAAITDSMKRQAKANKQTTDWLINQRDGVPPGQ